MPEAAADSEILNLAPGLSARCHRDVGSRHRQGPEGRGLRKEAGVANRGRARHTSVLPQGGARRAGGPAAHRAGPLPVRARSGPGLGDRAGCQAGSQGHSRRPAARSRRARHPGAGLRNRRGRGAAGRADRHPAGGHRRAADRVCLRGGAELLHRDRQTARRAHAVGAGGDGLRPGGRRRLPHAPARAHAAAQQERLRPLHQPAARHHRSALRGGGRLRPAHGRALRLRCAPGAERAAHPQGRIAPGRGGRSGGRVLLHRSVDRFAGARSLEALSADGGRGRLRQGAGFGLHRQGAGGNPRGAREGIFRAAARAGGSQQLSQRGGEDAGSRTPRGGGRQLRCRRSAWPSRSRRSAGAPPNTRWPRAATQGAAAQARRRQDEGRALQLLLQFLRLRGLRHGGSRGVRRARTPT